MIGEHLHCVRPDASTSANNTDRCSFLCEAYPLAVYILRYIKILPRSVFLVEEQDAFEVFMTLCITCIWL